MAEMNKKIEQMLAEENTDGIILEINEQLLEEKNAVENLKSSLAEKTVKAVVVSEAETLFEEKVNVLYGLYESVKEQNIPVVVCGNAPTVRETVLSVIENKDVLTSHKLNRTMEQAGFELAETSDIVVEAVESKEDAARMNNSFTKYMDWAESFLEQEPVAQNYVRKYTAKEARPENTEERPFLTIVTRTQGKRPEALSEVLLSLMGQSCQDFELLVLGHKVEEERANKVKAIIEEVPEELRKRIQYVPVDYGNRTAPLNKGFELARGEYAVILDDDDLVLDNWVEKFKEKAETDYGKILHSYVIAQDWSAIKTENGEEMLRASGSPQNHFCRDFNILTELSGNYCPVLGLAFPTRPFQELNIRFDETLDTTEDWDFLMRMSTLCGVADIPVPTSIYRLWRNAENSQTLHNRAVWNENHLKIQKKFEKYPIFLMKHRSKI